MIQIEQPVPIIIPYLAQQAQGRELEYAVAGWRRHFCEPCQIYIVGDFHPIIASGRDIAFIPCPRVDDIPGQYRPHLDHVHKFRKAMDALGPGCKGFIYACDDMYAVNDFGMEEILLPKVVSMDMHGNPSSENGWQRDLYKTQMFCREQGLPEMNWVCHLPVYYECNLLKQLYDQLDADHNSYVIENIYFNAIYKNRKPLRIDIRWDNLKCGVYRPDPDLATIRKAFDTKIWITNSPKGWVPELDQMLNAYYFRR